MTGSRQEDEHYKSFGNPPPVEIPGSPAIQPECQGAGGSVRHIPYVDLAAQYNAERALIHECVDEVFSAGRFVGGPRIFELEAALAQYVGAQEAVALSSGTDALMLALHVAGVGPGDEVITAPNSFVASAAAIVHVGARPVFVDVREDMNIDPDLVEAAITPRTKAILPVHLTGRICAMDDLQQIAGRRQLTLIEDAAQAFGARFHGRAAGTLGLLGCFSAHPLKNFNAAGDAGFITTDDAELAARVRRLRSHGQINRDQISEWGVNARMDVLQAVLMLRRLPLVAAITEARRRNAMLYQEGLAARPEIILPTCRPHEFNVFHTFIVQTPRRDALQNFLHRRGVGTAIHYPIPIHLQPPGRALGYGPGSFPVAERQAATILSLPIHQHLAPDDIANVIDSVHAFFSTQGAP